MRSKKIARIISVQQKLHKQAQVELTLLEQESEALSLEQRATIAALNDDQNFQGLFTDVMARRLKILAASADMNEAHQSLQRERILERGLDLKRSEKLQVRIVSQEKSVAEKKIVSEMTELLSVRGQIHNKGQL